MTILPKVFSDECTGGIFSCEDGSDGDFLLSLIVVHSLVSFLFAAPAFNKETPLFDPDRFIVLGALANMSLGGSLLINFHQPLSRKDVKPDRNMNPLQCDIVPEIVPNHVLRFFICGPNRVIQLFSRKAATCNFQ